MFPCPVNESYTYTMMALKILMYLLLGFLLIAFPCSNGELSSSCLMVYEEGGASAVFESPDCPDWNLSSFQRNTETSRENLFSGSTATIVLIVDGQILVAYVGDSKALLCSKAMLYPQEAKDQLVKERFDEEGTIDSSAFGLQNLISSESGSGDELEDMWVSAARSPLSSLH
ncbi:hypothetical protein HHK36_023241 [Tetracentron sinense]|uniref:PPM-type phosphatase domain-containing protein n=1 Tax=Tetracentron sinense TaxID=13715 RepID=A0A834YQ27_TETSI|nr:hypothetical protein HHK36_023241 [Tetracentron sinense]